MRGVSILLGPCAAVLLSSAPATAATFPGTSFTHHDWELACDNTGTCRAAGYSVDGSELPISLLLTRKAGANQPVTGEVMLGEYGDNPVLDAMPGALRLTLQIGRQTHGPTRFPKDARLAAVSAPQVAALIAALRGTRDIAWTDGTHRWTLSGQGAAAVLLKMDEYQGRLGTRGALMRPGPLGEDGVPPAAAVPQVQAAALARPLPQDALLPTRHADALRAALRQSLAQADDCPDLTEPRSPDDGVAPIEVTRLDNHRLLASARCWLGAYNVGVGYWVIDEAPPFRPEPITASGSDFIDGSILASQKGRGLGDCWSSDEWTWDGRRFVHTAAATTGMCRLMAPGGAWSLPTIVTDVLPPSR